jgi:flagellin
MAQVINTNLSSLAAQRALNSSQGDVSTSLQRLSSGLRINGAADDAAGLAISQRMTAQINGLNQAARNAADGTSLSQTAEGALSEVTSNLQRIRELAVQSSNATNSTKDRSALQAEVSQLMEEINRVSNQTQFNGVSLLNGSFTSQAFQVGANASETVSIANIASSRTADLGTFTGIVETNVAFTANNALSAKTVVLGGAVTSLGNVADSAKAIAAALNSSGLGFSASAAATSEAGTTSSVAGLTIAGKTDTFTVNGVAVSLTSSTNAASNRAEAVAKINAQTASTGVTATDAGSSVTLSAADGRNIVTKYTDDGTHTALAATYGLTANDAANTATATAAVLSVTLKTSTTGTVQLTGVAAGGGGFAQNAANIGVTGTALSTNDVTSASKASAMITAVDSALDSVNTSRASLGALQNRFDSIVNSVLIASENQSASRSRIVDADFAAETAKLTKGQILQQAGVAVLAQANAAPQNVLALLQ